MDRRKEGAVDLLLGFKTHKIRSIMFFEKNRINIDLRVIFDAISK